MAKPTTDDFNKWEAGKKGAKAKARKGPARRFSVEKLDDGSFSSAAEHDINPDKERSMMDYPGRMSTSGSHKNINDAAKTMIALFGGGGGEMEEEPKQPKTPEKQASTEKKDKANAK